jgi:hypothetical protein
LVPALHVPEIEVCSATVHGEFHSGEYPARFEAVLYIIPKRDEKLYIRFDRCKATFRCGDRPAIELRNVRVEPPMDVEATDSLSVHVTSRSLTIRSCDEHAEMSGPGMALLRGNFNVWTTPENPDEPFAPAEPIHMRAELGIVGLHSPVVIEAMLMPSQKPSTTVAFWEPPDEASKWSPF